MVVSFRYVKHPKYKKFMKKTRKFSAQPGNKAKEGDMVTIRSCPLSKTKHFEIVFDQKK